MKLISRRNLLSSGFALALFASLGYRILLKKFFLGSTSNEELSLPYRFRFVLETNSESELDAFKYHMPSFLDHQAFYQHTQNLLTEKKLLHFGEGRLSNGHFYWDYVFANKAAQQSWEQNSHDFLNSTYSGRGFDFQLSWDYVSVTDWNKSVFCDKKLWLS